MENNQNLPLFDLNSFNPNENYVIEASAGTGKTYNIIEMVKKMVNHYHIPLNEILIVTYTDKAAGELKDRIRKSIKDQDVDNAPIFTIHSFCQTAIREFSISAKSPSNLTLADDNSLLNFVQRYIRSGDILSNIGKAKEFCYGFNVECLADKLVCSLSKYYLNFRNEEDPSVISLYTDIDYQYYFDLLCDTGKCSFEELCDHYPEIKLNIAALASAENDDLAHQFASELVSNYVSGFDFNGRLYTEKKFAKSEESVRSAFRYFYNLKKRIGGLPFDNNGFMTNAITFKYLKDFYIQWQKEKEKNKEQSFDDMIRTVRECILHDDLLKAKLKKKYRYAIIDEFQDTNQRQFDIFESIFLNDNEHHIVVVGDPKQSIYAFQGADIEVYHNAVTKIAGKGGNMTRLAKNFRSSKNMVSSCNKLFHYYDFDKTTFTDSDYIDDIKSENGRPHQHMARYLNNDVKAFYVACSKDEKSPLESMDEDCFANIAVQQIVDFCTIKDGRTNLQVSGKDDYNADGSPRFRNVSFRDFTVLARTSSEMGPIEKALRAAGIPCIRYKDKSLFTGRECFHWISVLKAVDTSDFVGSNRNRFYKALFSSFFGKSLKEINSDYYKHDDIPEVALFNRWRQLAFQKRWEDFIDSIVNESSLNENLKELSFLQSLSVYKQIGNYCIDYLTNSHSLEDLIHHLCLLSNGGNDSEEESEGGAIVEKSTNFDCVQIMTIHASKGLQFPIVILAGGFKGPLNASDAYTYHYINEETHEERKVLSFEKNDQCNIEEEAEWKRLFYVAYTRAQFLILIPKYQEAGMEFLFNTLDQMVKEHNEDITIIHDNKRLPASYRTQVKAILHSSEILDDTEELEQQNKVLKDLIRQSGSKCSYKHSYSSLSHDNVPEEETDEDNEEVETNLEGTAVEGLRAYDKSGKQIAGNYQPDFSPLEVPAHFPKGAVIGTALHAIFEHSSFTHFEDRLEKVITLCYEEQGLTLKDGFMDYTKAMVGNVLHAALPVIHGNAATGEYFSLSTVEDEDKKPEIEFNFNLLNGHLRNYCNGFIDLLFRRGDYYSIVDWKSDKLNEDDFTSYSDSAILKYHVDDHYSIQRTLYAYCLVDWLKIYYPSLSKEEIFASHFGGVYYVFLRGCNEGTTNGVYAQTWDSYQDLEASFNQIIHDKIGGKK